MPSRMPGMADLDLDKLETVARAATPGKWRIRTNSRHSPDECDLSICDDIFILADINGPQYPHQEANAAHIAAFNPKTAIALIQALRDARRAAFEEAARVVLAFRPEGVPHPCETARAQIAAAIRAMKP